MPPPPLRLLPVAPSGRHKYRLDIPPIDSDISLGETIRKVGRDTRLAIKSYRLLARRANLYIPEPFNPFTQKGCGRRDVSHDSGQHKVRPKYFTRNEPSANGRIYLLNRNARLRSGNFRRNSEDQCSSTERT